MTSLRTCFLCACETSCDVLEDVFSICCEASHHVLGDVFSICSETGRPAPVLTSHADSGETKLKKMMVWSADSPFQTLLEKDCTCSTNVLTGKGSVLGVGSICSKESRRKTMTPTGARGGEVGRSVGLQTQLHGHGGRLGGTVVVNAVQGDGVSVHLVVVERAQRQELQAVGDCWKDRIMRFIPHRARAP